MCFVPNEQKFKEVVGEFVTKRKPFTSLEVKMRCREVDPQNQWDQTEVGNELRSMFNRGLLGDMVSSINRDPVVHVVYSTPNSHVLRKRSTAN